MSSPRVLVVDDEADLRELLEITLVRMGLDVDSAETLKQARAFLALNEYALVLTDMRLPDGLGLYLARELCLNNEATLDYEYRFDASVAGAYKASGRFVIMFAQPLAVA